MPSSPNYVRDYKQEAKTAKARGENPDDATRHRARYAMEKAGKAAKNDGKDVGHKRALGKGGTNHPGNLEMQARSDNRSFSRNADGSMKSEKSKREKK
jgi:hypothetical protein